ncbi:MAG: BlaI/MecI/CopY family transcriptional regulator [Clostridia bacterium]|nr:BlaI/MecI/CopY family transcriptional regulator [Clostridia bacterium]
MPTQITEAEWKIMDLLWDRAPRTMSEITQALEPETGWTRHTVITLLKRLAEKGAVRVDESGPVRTYTPLVDRQSASAAETGHFLRRVFKGKASLLVNNLVDSGELSSEEIQELLDLLQHHESTEGKKK